MVNVARYDGSSNSWSALGISGPIAFPTINALAIFRGQVYAAGSSSSTYNCVLRWTGVEWEAAGSIRGNTAYTLAVADGDLALYAGGNFVTADGISTNMARWDGVGSAAAGARARDQCHAVLGTLRCS